MGTWSAYYILFGIYKGEFSYVALDRAKPIQSGIWTLKLKWLT